MRSARGTQAWACCFVWLGVVCFTSFDALGQLEISTTHSPFVINFDTTVSGVNNGQFAGTGFQSTPSAGQLDSDAWAVTGFSNGDLAFGGTRTTSNTDYTRGLSSGGVSTGGLYAFNVGSDNRALGIQPTKLDDGDPDKDWVPGTLTLRLQNKTGEIINDFTIGYKVYVRNDTNTASTFNFSYSTDGSNFTSVSSQNLTSPTASGSSEWVLNTRSFLLNGFAPVANNAFFHVRWTGDDSVAGTGQRDEFALDDISFVANPEPATYFLTAVGMASAWFVRRRHGSRKMVNPQPEA